MPSNREELAAALEGRPEAPYLRHYLEVRDRREELLQYAAQLATAPIIPAAAQRALTLLPFEVVSEYPPVAFVIFANDARGYDPIVVDLLASLRWDYETFLAHEFHHWYRNRLLIFDFESIDPRDRDVVWTLNQVHGEGIADQLDKRAWALGQADPPSGLEGYARRYREHLSASPGLIRTLGSLMVRYRDPGADRAALGAEIREAIPQSGHPTGFFMANAILQHFGQDALVSQTGNPFSFFRLHNRAAGVATSGVPFSAEAMLLLDELEASYGRR
jgi:hypothetical protein